MNKPKRVKFIKTIKKPTVVKFNMKNGEKLFVKATKIVRAK